MSLELDRLYWNLAVADADSDLARIASDPAYKSARIDSPRAISLIDRRWFMAGVYLVAAMVIGALISMVIA